MPGGLIAEESRELLGVMEIFCVLIKVIVTWAYTLAQTHNTVPLKGYIFIICKLYLNKVDSKSLKSERLNI